MKKSKALILPVITLGHPTLRKVAKKVKNPLSSEIQEFIPSLVATINSFGGVGIAAPQVNRSLRIIVVASKPVPRYPNAPLMTPTVMINPVIAKRSSRLVKDWEGCGSLLGVRALIPRYVWIDVSYLDQGGRPQQVRLQDFPARIAQHEIDHLDGIMFVDGVASSKLVADQYFQEVILKKK